MRISCRLSQPTNAFHRIENAVRRRMHVHSRPTIWTRAEWEVRIMSPIRGRCCKVMDCRASSWKLDKIALDVLAGRTSLYRSIAVSATPRCPLLRRTHSAVTRVGSGELLVREHGRGVVSVGSRASMSICSPSGNGSSHGPARHRQLMQDLAI